MVSVELGPIVRATLLLNIRTHSDIISGALRATFCQLHALCANRLGVWLLRGAKLIFLWCSLPTGIWNSFRWERNTAVGWSETTNCHCQSLGQKSAGAPSRWSHICLGYRERKGTKDIVHVIYMFLCVNGSMSVCCGRMCNWHKKNNQTAGGYKLNSWWCCLLPTQIEWALHFWWVCHEAQVFCTRWANLLYNIYKLELLFVTWRHFLSINVFILFVKLTCEC
jgi:hypothetical protein